MTDRWMIHGTEFENCPCAWGCPCQFGAKSTHGHCEALMGGHIEEGNFNDTSLDGLDWVVLMYWPGEVARGQRHAAGHHRRTGGSGSARSSAQDPAWRVDHPRSDAFLHVQQHDVDRAGHAVRTHRTVDRCRSANGQPHDRRAGRVTRDATPQAVERRIAEEDPPQYAGRAALSLCRDGQRQHHSAGGNRARLQGQLLPVQRSAHEPGRTDPLTTSWVWRHRDRLAVLTGLAGITVAAWVYVVVTARRMATGSAGMGSHRWRR